MAGSGLTVRELQVLRLVALVGAKEAAHQLGISTRTIHVHRHNAHRKLGAHSQSEAHRKLGWLQVPEA